MRSVRFKSFSSGSCGNCYFLGLEEDGVWTDAVLVDAGVSLRAVKRELLNEHIPLSCIKAMLVTHDHFDHIRSLGSYCKYLKLPVWATPELLTAMSYHSYTLEHLAAVRCPLERNVWNDIIPGVLSARYFVVPHDASQTVGYGIRLAGLNFVIMTDLGRMTAEALSYASHAHVVVVESNYDREMLMNGSYPYELKMRISRGNGHLSNDECADAVRRFYHKDLTHLFLCHLSENNNTPELAIKATSDALADIGLLPSYERSSYFASEEGDSIVMQPLPRRTPSRLFTLLEED
jgi:phosphoribosyl 1,2-cyclic phosphodiesterase